MTGTLSIVVGILDIAGGSSLVMAQAPITLLIPVTVYRFDPKTFNKGLETHRVSGHAPEDLQRRAQRDGLFQVSEQAWNGRGARGAASGATKKAGAEQGAAALRTVASCRKSHVTIPAGDRIVSGVANTAQNRRFEIREASVRVDCNGLRFSGRRLVLLSSSKASSFDQHGLRVMK